MRASDVALRRFITELPDRLPGVGPSWAIVELAERAHTLGPRSLDGHARDLLAQQETPAALAQIVLASLRGMAGDIEEHGAQAVFVGEKAFIKKSITFWARHARADAVDDVLLAEDLEASLVAVVEHVKLPPAEAKAWATLRKAARLPKAVTTLTEKPVAPWFAELVAAHIGRELADIARSSQATSWTAKLADVPALLALLDKLGMPPLFGPRAVRHARRAAERHDHAPTKAALAAMPA
ncbi:MAG: hypothetical protein NT062_27710 [Proteobacteria bacterium]|nr:hypothetical protein [Pseudomonadota bacterium]